MYGFLPLIVSDPSCMALGHRVAFSKQPPETKLILFHDVVQQTCDRSNADDRLAQVYITDKKHSHDTQT
jgi:hypothetical protein